MTQSELGLSDPVSYHYGGFPPTDLRYNEIISPLAHASAAIARYEQMLQGIHNPRFFLAPLERQEAISSSRMEGTISSLDELLVYEANLEEGKSTPSARQDTLEVHAYRIAMNTAEKKMMEGEKLSDEFLCGVHKSLLAFTRGRDKNPGEFKTTPNYLVDGNGRLRFTPIRPNLLQQGLSDLYSFINTSEEHPLVKTAIAHVEFEALHPFNDGNGRMGRILITLMMWELGLISRPCFYISGSLERKKGDYINLMRNVSATGDWTSWCIFFLEAVRGQAYMNLDKSEKLRDLYERMKEIFRECLSSKWSINALDFMFANPVFRNNTFTSNASGIPQQTAHRFTRKLLDAELLIVVQHPSGRSAGLYAFEPLLQILRD